MSETGRSNIPLQNSMGQPLDCPLSTQNQVTSRKDTLCRRGEHKWKAADNAATQACLMCVDDGAECLELGGIPPGLGEVGPVGPDNPMGIQQPYQSCLLSHSVATYHWVSQQRSLLYYMHEVQGGIDLCNIVCLRSPIIVCADMQRYLVRRMSAYKYTCLHVWPFRYSLYSAGTSMTRHILVCTRRSSMPHSSYRRGLSDGWVYH